MQQDFDLCAEAVAMPHAFETRGNDARVIDDEKIARPQQLRQIADAPI